MITTSVILVLFYFLLISGFLMGWKSIKPVDKKLETLTPTTRVSLVVAFRNEEQNLPTLIKAIKNQNYPHQLLEVILVNDHSTDNSLSAIQKHLPASGNITILDLPGKHKGKKEAMAFGIEQARGPLVVTTDADCWFGKYWIKLIAAFYESTHSEFIFGPVKMEQKKGLLSIFQAVEFASLASSAAGAAGIGHPIMCNAANMAIKKSTWTDIRNQLNTTHPSGDDIFLLLAIKKRHPRGIHFIKSAEAMVSTHGETSLKNFLRQRIRWASKSKNYTDTDIVVTAFTVFLLNAWMLFLLFTSPFIPGAWYFFFTLFMLKTAIDYVFLQSIAQFFQIRKLGLIILPLQIIYIFYTPVTAIVAFLGNFTWKGRKYKAGKNAA